MTVYIFYTKGTPGFEVLERYSNELSGGPIGIAVELIEADSQHGVALAELYDIFDRPAMVLVDGNNAAVKTWIGEFPPAGDVRYMAGSV